MPYKNESMLMGGDATADIETQLCFDPPGGPFPPGNDNVVRGTIAHPGDEDWVKIELTAGVLYTFTLTDDDGDDTTYLDTILQLYDGKGGRIKGNDDIDGPMGNLHSSFQYVPEQDGAHFLSASVFTANLGAPSSGAYRLTVTQSAAGLPDPIEGTEGDDKLRGTDAGERLSGLGGNDSLFGLAGDDVLNGGAGNDLLVGGAGGDRLNGGAGNDTISYNTSMTGVTVSLRDATARGGHASGDIIAADIENVTGSSSPDALTGNDEMNILNGLGGDDVLRGDFGDDTLNGGPGDDELDGGHDNDTLAGGPGADRLTGGEGNDTASFAGSMEGVEVRLHANRLAGGDAEGDVFVDTTTVMYQERPDPEEPPVSRSETVPDIIHLVGSGLADVLAGDSRSNTIMGGGGDDMIYGGPKGDDTSNNDTLMGQGGNDKIYGGKGVDTLDGGPGNDLLVGGSGADAFVGGPGSDMIYADRADIASTIHGHNMPTDTDGDDPTGAMGKMAGEMDTLSFAKFTDQDLEDGTGITLTLEANTAVTNINRLIGTSGEDMLTGRTGTDDAPAPEIIEGGADQDTLVGGDGPGDTVSYESSDRGVDVELKGGTAGTDTATDSEASGGHARRDTISGFENVMGSAYDDSLTAVTGTAGEVGSTLWGLDGDDELTGLAGNDTLEGGAGADELDGGLTRVDGTTPEVERQNAQINTLSYAMSDAGVRVDLTASSAAGGHAEGDEIETYRLTIGDRDFEVATFINVTGSDHNDTLTGDLFGNQLVGGTGDDTLLGGIHADTLIGGPGADTLNGGSSTRDHDEDEATPEVQHEDWAAYRDAMAGVAVNLHSGRGTAGEAMGDVLTGIELIWGSRHDDTFIASAGADRIHGDGGVDTVSYEASLSGVTVVLPTTDDTAQFDADGPDDDAETLEDNGVQAALDSVVTAWRAGTATRPDPVQADDGLTSTRSYAEGDQLESIENVTGSRRNDVITGDGVPNVLMGGAGNDELVGGGENDTLHGGEGNDLLGQTTAKAAVDLNGDGDELDPGEAAVDAIEDDADDDMMFGGPGNDRLYGGAGADTLNGGPGDDDLQGDAQDDLANPTNTDPDTFVFTKDGLGSDLILDFSNETGVAIADGTADANGEGDKIDLRAFDIEAGDLPGLLGERGGSVILNLESYGGGRVFIQGGVTLEGLMGADDDGDGELSESELHLIHDDQNGMEAGVGDEGTDGVFIL